MRSLFLLHDVQGDVIAVNPDGIDFCAPATPSKRMSELVAHLGPQTLQPYWRSIITTRRDQEFKVRESFRDLSDMMDEKIGAGVGDEPRRFDFLVDNEPVAINLDAIDIVHSAGMELGEQRPGSVVILRSGNNSYSVDRSVSSIVTAILVTGVQPQIARELMRKRPGRHGPADLMGIAFSETLGHNVADLG